MDKQQAITHYNNQLLQAENTALKQQLAESVERLRVSNDRLLVLDMKIAGYRRK